MPEICVPKVLLVGPSFDGGGAEARFAAVARNAFHGQIDTAVLILKQPLTGQVVDQVLNLEWRSRLSYLRAAWLLRRQLKRKSYDVVMAFGLFPGLVLSMAVLRLSPTPRVIYNEITRPQMESAIPSGWHNSVRAKIYLLMRKWIYRRASLLTANSTDGVAEMCELAGVPVACGARLPNVIDLRLVMERASAQVSLAVPAIRYVICAGRLDHMKNIDTVIDAISLLGEVITCNLIIAGDGEARSGLKEQVDALGLAGRVIFTGWIDNPLPLLANASGFVLASSYEGFSNAVLEAMLCRVPVVTSYCSTDAIEMCHQGAALGFEVGDADALKCHIQAILTKPDLVDSLVSQAIRYSEKHTLPVAIEQYENVLRGDNTCHLRIDQ